MCCSWRSCRSHAQPRCMHAGLQWAQPPGWSCCSSAGHPCDRTSRWAGRPGGRPLSSLARGPRSEAPSSPSCCHPAALPARALQQGQARGQLQGLMRGPNRCWWEREHTAWGRPCGPLAGVHPLAAAASLAVPLPAKRVAKQIHTMHLLCRSHTWEAAFAVAGRFGCVRGGHAHATFGHIL